MPPSRPRTWSDYEVSESAQRAIDSLFDRLLSLEMFPPEHINDDLRPLEIPLTVEAKDMFIRFVNENGKEQADLDGDLAATWSKLEGYGARFALVHQLIRWANGKCAGEHIDAESMAAGIALARWFGQEARRVHATFVESDEEREQRELIEWIQRHGGRTSVRDLMQKVWRYRTSSDVARSDLQSLVKVGFGYWEQSATDGRPGEDFVLNDSGHQQNSELEAEVAASVDVDASSAPSIELGERFLTSDEIEALAIWEWTA